MGTSFKRLRLFMTALMVCGLASSPVDASAARGKGKGKHAAKAARSNPKKEAKKLFQQAQKHYKLGEFQAALNAYVTAYETFPVAGLLFNIGQCYMELRNYERAAFFYDQYLSEKPDAPNADVVEERLAQAQQELVKATEAAKLSEEQRRQQELARQAELRREEEDRRQREAEAARRVQEEAAAKARVVAAAPVQATQAMTATTPPESDPLHVRASQDGSPFYTTWWFWGIVGGVAVAAGGTAYYLMNNRTETVLPEGDLGVVDRRALYGAPAR